jgi:hypothetical protein
MIGFFYAMESGKKLVTKYDESFSDAEEKVKSYNSINNKEILK